MPGMLRLEILGCGVLLFLAALGFLSPSCLTAGTRRGIVWWKGRRNEGMAVVRRRRVEGIWRRWRVEVIVSGFDLMNFYFLA